MFKDMCCTDVTIMLSHIIICGVETIEQHIVDKAELKKSIPGPKLRLIVSAYRDFETRSFIRLRTSSSIAKLTAPWGKESTNWAPAPRDNCFAYFHCANDFTVKGACPGTARDDCSIVFIVFAGCMIVWAVDRLIAPHNIASQKCRRRSGTSDVSPPLQIDEIP